MKTIKDTINVWARTEWLYYYYSKVKTSLQQYIDTTYEATQIVDNLWLGSITSSCNREALHENGIEMIISAILGSTAAYPYDFNYERAKLRDVEDEDIITDIYRLIPIIHAELMQKRGVLVHCFYGRSRSASICIAYLIRYHNMTMEEALAFVKSKRTQVSPNPGYLTQLKQFENEVRGERDSKKNV
jgi:predicted protein tyrosine phosphatase